VEGRGGGGKRGREGERGGERGREGERGGERGREGERGDRGLGTLGLHSRRLREGAQLQLGNHRMGGFADHDRVV
jgi:polyribonucleotide nucleotidyltransferase